MRFHPFYTLLFFTPDVMLVSHSIFGHHPQIHSLMKSFGSMCKNFNIPSPKSQFLKKEPSPKARRPMLNPDASPHANWLARPPSFPEICEEDEDAPEDNNRCQSRTLVTTRRKKPRSLATPHDGTPSPSLLPTSSDRGNHSSRYRRIVTETEQETYITAAERPYHRWQRQLEL